MKQVVSIYSIYVPIYHHIDTLKYKTKTLQSKFIFQKNTPRQRV